MGGAEPDERCARARRTHLLVGIDEHGEDGVVTKIHRLEHGERVQDQRDTVLVVGDAEPVGAVAIDAERLAAPACRAGRRCPCGRSA